VTEIKAHIGKRCLSEMGLFRMHFPEGLADTFIGLRIQPAVETGLIHHRHKRAVREQGQ